MSTPRPSRRNRSRPARGAACGALEPPGALLWTTRRPVCSKTCLRWLACRPILSQPVRVPQRLLLKLAARSYDAGRAEVRRLDPWLAFARFKDRPEAVQRGFLVTVQQIVDWARRHPAWPSVSASNPLIAQVISPQRRSAAAGRRRVPGTTKITDERHIVTPKWQTDVRAAHSVHRLVCA